MLEPIRAHMLLPHLGLLLVCGFATIQDRGIGLRDHSMPDSKQLAVNSVIRPGYVINGSGFLE